VKLAELKDNMQRTIESTQKSFNTLRTGRANTAILDRITVEYYGAETALKSLATINTPDATTITIQPFDRGSMGAIKKAILMSDIGLTPNNDGQTIRLNIPQLTSERRQELVKMANKMAEEGKVALRNIRREAMDAVKKQAKSHEIAEDEAKDLEDQIQKITNQYTAKIDEIMAVKEKDIKTI
jgi:ribosome recycling factor